jgi:hypothetical protein
MKRHQLGSSVTKESNLADICVTKGMIEFIVELRKMIETETKPGKKTLVSWGAGKSGDGFVVADRKQFTTQVLHEYFPTLKTWAGFRKKLWRHAFKKVDGGLWTHPLLNRSIPPDILQQQELQEQPPSQPQPKSVNPNADTSKPDNSRRHRRKRERPSVDGSPELEIGTESQMLKRQKQVTPGWRSEPNEQNFVVL